MINSALDPQLDALTVLARSGVQVPPELAAGVEFVSAELRGMAALVRRPREAASEPASVFLLDAVLGNRKTRW
jgi:hypothetical protein